MDLTHEGQVDEAWASAVEAELRRHRPNGEGNELARRARQELLGALPPGYMQQTAPAEAAWDCAVGLAQPVAGAVTLAPSREDASGEVRLRRAGPERVELSSWLPVLGSFGLVVVEAVPWHFVGTDGRPLLFVDDIGLRVAAGRGAGAVATPCWPAPPERFASGLEPSGDGRRLVEAIEAVTSGRGEITPLNSLVVTAGLDWRQVNLLCAYCRYRHQSGGQSAPAKASALQAALVSFPRVAAAILGLCEAMSACGEATGAPGDVSLAGRRQAVQEALGGVPDLEHDEALGELVAMVEATTRSTWASSGPVIALKFDSNRLPFLPLPRPFAEIYVWSTWFEGLHLRFGPVARGGVRWSDRSTDLRGEVLGLARAQVKKNSLIVPTGAKGAFCTRRHGAKAGDAYAAFIEALLDVTDNVVDGRVVHPPIVCRDGDDPYLVVAADKGTAHFSDLANSISTSRVFWLGDAFASGGSNGYDHKAMGITAKGAWLAVRRHFRALGMDADAEELRVAGVGDMSGDVFGNGMLCSKNIKLVAAFDHRHVFVDPAPAPAPSFAERSRLACLGTSSWADYDLTQASEGAAVYERHAKQAELSPQARAALGTKAQTMPPPELVKAVLMAPVDLLFFGGIGTFARGPGENDIDIEDHADDGIRLDAKQLRARVITEGANLALTQQARAAYSRRGGRVNADFVDNAAGVALSDREVNIKVLLRSAVASGRATAEGAAHLLAAAQEEAAASVLDQVDWGIVALDRAAAQSPAQFAAYEALLGDLESEGLLDRHVEALPDDEELGRRAGAGAGLSRPELAVLVAYARSELARAIQGSALSAGGDLGELVLAYFPPSLLAGLEDLATSHPLARQLAASQLANEVLAHMGPVWAHETASETGHGLDEVAGAYWVARQVLGAGGIIARLAGNGASWPVEAEDAVRDALAGALGRLARWYLLQPGPLEATALIAADGPVAVEVAGLLSTDEALTASLTAAGAPAGVAGEAAKLSVASVAGEVSSACQRTGCTPGEALVAMSALGESLSLPALRRRLVGAQLAGRWDRRQQHLLGDDLSRCTVALAAAALAPGGYAGPGRDGPGRDGAVAVEELLARRPTAADRYRALASQVANGPFDLSLVAVALRSLAQLTG